MRQKFEVSPSYLGAMYFLTKFSTDAILLYCIWTWGKSTKSMKDEKGEKGWFAFTRDQWMTNSGLTKDQYNRSIGRLKKSGYIKFKHRRLSRKDKGRPLLWIKIEEDFLQKIENIRQSFFCIHKGVMQKRLDSKNAILTPHSNGNVAILKREGRVAEKLSINKRDKIERQRRKGKGLIPLEADHKGSPLSSGKDSRERIKLKYDSESRIKNDSKIKNYSEFELPIKFSGTKEFEEYWRAHFKVAYPNRKFSWVRFEREGVARQVINRIESTKLSSALLIKDVILNWDDYREAITSQSFSKTYCYPRIETLQNCLQIIVQCYVERMRASRHEKKEDRLNKNYKKDQRKLENDTWC